MKRRKWEHREKMLIVLEGLKGKPVGGLNNKHKNSLVGLESELKAKLDSRLAALPSVPEGGTILGGTIEGDCFSAPLVTGDALFLLVLQIP